MKRSVLLSLALAGATMSVGLSAPLAHARSKGIAYITPGLDVAFWLYVSEGVKNVATAGGYEMEDQRNWTDASYKTYVRPLALP